MTDPLRPARGAANLGAAGLARTGDTRWELATVIEYNSATHTAVVRTNNGRPLPDVPQLRYSQGGFDHLETGTTVVVSWDLGIPMIIGVLDLVGPAQTALPRPTLTGVEGVGQDDPTQPAEGTNNYKPPHAPSDMGGGDWAQMGALGNHVAVLQGGLTLVGAPTAQVQSHAPAGLLRHVARRMEGVSDFGLWRTENVEGRTSFILRAGSNQTTQTGLDEQHWTIRIDLGASGDMFDFRIQEPEGKTLFRLHAGSDGRVQIYGDGGVDLSSGAGGPAEMRHDVAGARTTTVAGTDVHSVQGDATRTVDGNHSDAVAGNAVRAVGGDATHYVSGNHAHGVGGEETCVVGGDRTTQIGGDDDHRTDGNYTIGTDKAFDVRAKATATINAQGIAKVTGKQVILGPNGAHPAPKWDVFLVDFGTFLGDLISAIGALVPSNPIGLAVTVAKITLFATKIGVQIPYASTTVRND